MTHPAENDAPVADEWQCTCDDLNHPCDIHDTDTDPRWNASPYVHPDDGHLLSCTLNFDHTWSCDPTCPIPPASTDRPSAKEQP